MKKRNYLLKYWVDVEHRTQRQIPHRVWWRRLLGQTTMESSRYKSKELETHVLRIEDSVFDSREAQKMLHSILMGMGVEEATLEYIDSEPRHAQTASVKENYSVEESRKSIYLKNSNNTGEYFHPDWI